MTTATEQADGLQKRDIAVLSFTCNVGTGKVAVPTLLRKVWDRPERSLHRQRFLPQGLFYYFSHVSGSRGVVPFHIWKWICVSESIVSTVPMTCPVVTLSPAFTETFRSLQ